MTGDKARPTVRRSDAEWRAYLADAQYQQYHMTRRQGTGRAFAGPDRDARTPGAYRCICCEQALFRSDTRFDSGTGWPVFFAPVTKDAMTGVNDRSWFMKRTEIRCAAHPGHVFNDGPRPTGLRYCMNGTALERVPDKD